MWIVDLLTILIGLMTIADIVSFEADRKRQ
jgi:hypothetical protein